MLSKNKKLPRWIVNLTSHSNNTSRLKAAYPGVKNERMIDEICRVLGDDALSYITQYNKQKLKFAYKICKELPEGKKLSFKDFKELLRKNFEQTEKRRQNAIMEKHSRKIEDSFKEMKDAIEAKSKEIEKAYEELNAELAKLKELYMS